MLEVRDLEVAFGPVAPLSGVNFSINKGETLGIVGESGSGKSLTAMSVMGLLPLSGGRITAGSIMFDGQDLTKLKEPAYRKLRGGRIGLITQNPMTSLDPLQKIGGQVDAVAMLHLGMTPKQARARTVEILGTLRIPEPATICNRYPHQMSGGMKQRIVIAMALAADPDVLVADEPTTALDVTVQAQIMRLLHDLVKDRDLALVLITHDMSVVAQTCDKVVVMYAGRAIEHGPVEAIFDAPQHPYTQALINCIPKGLSEDEHLTGIPGTVPTVLNYPDGCPFHPRCTRAQDICAVERPAVVPFGSGGAACHFAGAAP
ncbi:ABC transporter ATP-binding protein [Sulfitobacter mediterraneus]|jgi:peptide/nickel transport system ATP-binding protein|uniref:ABC transporter ATP-binding protein n=1 Tax=Sulfitobacter TaxID=60136 RepID=UPI001933AC3B|nr:MULTISPECIES: ABC transporter ATP-binding protein [Sulfitobacter]MBM1635160.1 ABC transporter ATP-binding protein [Sulfitobacter mediterraneus]MBM1642984.1 ABC transporter ATP-binding protein [Sulfitobacter mediterraneus]MBM1647032.1 ABC transporter ATP-binding protein [Sulfitobacter mediterraneus]MBM1651074.1 ABC transporter ATP-binding protein [Sulfitobacter mediterraneus]MBM1655025.1 ABC transporter ATP-binding protein [Sulfitobacter mediterraneus]